MIVVLAPEPTIFKLKLMVRFMIMSADDASEIACLIVLQAVVGEVQVLLLSPLTPLTYQVLAKNPAYSNSQFQWRKSMFYARGQCAQPLGERL
jgi:hypothetical protein